MSDMSRILELELLSEPQIDSLGDLERHIKAKYAGCLDNEQTERRIIAEVNTALDSLRERGLFDDVVTAKEFLHVIVRLET